MAKFSGIVGFGVPTEIRSGVWEDVITERTYFGDVVLNSRQLRDDEKVNHDFSVNNSISIVADAYASETFFAIRYVKWMGALWVVSDVTVQGPRLLLRLGGVYNGPTAAAASSA